MVSKRALSINNPGLAELIDAKVDNIKFTNPLSSVLCFRSTLERQFPNPIHPYQCLILINSFLNIVNTIRIGFMLQLLHYLVFYLLLDKMLPITSVYNLYFS